MNSKNILVLDIETTREYIGNDCLHIPYDIGGLIYDTQEKKVIEKFSFVIAEVFFNRAKMKKAFFYDKYERYLEQIGELKRKVSTAPKVIEYLNDIVDKYNINTKWAYNANFDKNGIDNLNKHYSDNKQGSFFETSTKCIWRLSTETFMKDKEFVKFCLQEHCLSPKGNIKTGAEFAYRYICKTPLFEEDHTGLEDALIELEIYQYCMNINPKADATPYAYCWKAVQPTEEQKEKIMLDMEQAL